jgi:hypothetical protein
MFFQSKSHRLGKVYLLFSNPAMSQFGLHCTTVTTGGSLTRSSHREASAQPMQARVRCRANAMGYTPAPDGLNNVADVALSPSNQHFPLRTIGKALVTYGNIKIFVMSW